MKILIRATNWIGDAVMSLPALRAIRARYPDAHIAILARPWVADIYAREPFCDRLIPYVAARGARDFAAKWRIAQSLRRENYDSVILLQNAFEAALIARLAGIPERIGYDRDARGWLLTRPIAVPKEGEIPPHERFYYLELLRRAGIVEQLPDSVEIRLEGAGAAREAGLAHFEAEGMTAPMIGVSPGAAYGSAKRWLPERFAEAAAEIADAIEASVAIFGSKEERELCQSVAADLTSRGVAVRNFAGETSLSQFIDLSAACRVFLSNDSGAMHIASALGVPTVAIFGATNHVTTGPTGEHARVVREAVECSPCLLRECPIDHRCMTRVPASRVARTALNLLK